MALNIRDKEVERLASELARLLHTTKTQAVKLALLQELARSMDLKDRLHPLQDRVETLADTGLVVNKQFFDDLNGEP